MPGTPARKSIDRAAGRWGDNIMRAGVRAAASIRKSRSASDRPKEETGKSPRIKQEQRTQSLANQKPIKSDLLQVGFCLPGTLRNRSGRLLLPAGSCLNTQDVQRLRRHGRRGLFGDADWPEEFFSSDNVRDSLVTPDFVRRLRRDRVRRRDQDAVEPPAIPVELNPARFDQLLREELAQCPPFVPVVAGQRPHIPYKELIPHARRGHQRYLQAVPAVRDVYMKLYNGGPISIIEARNAVIEYLDLIMLDFDLLPTILAAREKQTDYLYEQAIAVAMLSMAIGAQLGLSRREIIKVGLCGLLHDVGMLSLPSTVRLDHQLWNSRRREIVAKHPMETVKCLAKLDGVDDQMRVLTCQIHERCDGSGYPHGRREAEIHPMARIIAVADAYLALSAQRPYRESIRPYEAAKAVLLDAGKNRFDTRVVRALLDCISLFPIGSRVLLSDGQPARVIRANTSRHTRPVVMAKPDRAAPSQIINLSKNEQIRVIRA